MFGGIYCKSKDVITGDQFPDKKWHVDEDTRNANMVSIIMPVYNAGGYLRTSIQSILNQSYKNIELIVVDDGSDRPTKDILRSFNDSRMSIITLPKNKGIGNALNVGFAKARGVFHTWWASDNLMYSYCIEMLAKLLLGLTNVGFVYSIFNYENLMTGEKGVTPAESMRKSQNELLENYFLGICWLWKREITEKAGKWSTDEFEDWDMFIRMSMITDFRLYPLRPLGLYRHHADNNTERLKKDGQWDKRWQVSEKLFKNRLVEPRLVTTKREKNEEVSLFIQSLQ